MTLDHYSTATLDMKDWEMILFALENYVITQENKLIKENAGDAAWSNLEEYNTLIRDIQLYCIRWTMDYEGFDDMSYYTPEEIEAELQEQWENMWIEICDYANHLGLSPSYVEEEFYILGELHKVNTNPPVLNQKIVEETMKQIIKDTFFDDDNNNEFRFNPRPTDM